MRRLRWVTDAGGWELDAEAPVTMEGTARPVPGDPLPLGISRGVRITRPKQLDFMRRFMATPLVPSFTAAFANGGPALFLHGAQTDYLRENWSATILQQFDIWKFLSFVKESAPDNHTKLSLPKNLMRNMLDMISVGFGTEFWPTEDSSLLVEMYNLKKGTRSKGIFQHKFPKHNLTVEAACPGLFVDKDGTYWDVPLSMGIDLSSVSLPCGLNYHLCMQHNSGQPKHFNGAWNCRMPMSLLPGLFAKVAMSLRKNIDIWRKNGDKIKMVQPYDAFLSNPHVSASGIIGSVVTASLGENSARLYVEDGLQNQKTFSYCAKKYNFSLVGDIFATISFTAQHGNFQRLFLDLTRVNARLDFPSATKFLNGATCLVQDVRNRQHPDLEAIRSVCPDLTLALQQQLVGPFSFWVDSRIVVDSKDGRLVPRMDGSIFAIDWSLKVLGSARASAWYSLKTREAMVELRFFES